MDPNQNLCNLRTPDDREDQAIKLQFSQKRLDELEMRKSRLMAASNRPTRRSRGIVRGHSEEDIVKCQCGWNEDDGGMVCLEDSVDFKTTLILVRSNVHSVTLGSMCSATAIVTLTIRDYLVTMFVTTVSFRKMSIRSSQSLRDWLCCEEVCASSRWQGLIPPKNSPQNYVGYLYPSLAAVNADCVQVVTCKLLRTYSTAFDKKGTWSLRVARNRRDPVRPRNRSFVWLANVMFWSV